MSRCCQLTGHGATTGNRVSHAKNRTRHRFLPNLININLSSEILKRSFHLKITTRTLRTIDKKDGFDKFLLNTKNRKLTPKAIKIKKELITKADIKFS